MMLTVCALRVKQVEVNGLDVAVRGEAKALGLLLIAGAGQDLEALLAQLLHHTAPRVARGSRNKHLCTQPPTGCPSPPLSTVSV